MSSRSRRRPPFSFLLVPLLFAARAVNGQIVVTGSAARGEPGAEPIISFYFLNTSDAAQPVDPPPELPATLVGDVRSTAVTLRRIAAAGPSTVESRRFQKIDYLLPLQGVALPSNAVVEVPAFQGVRVAIAPVPGTPAVSPADASPYGLPNEPALTPNDSGIAETILPRFSPHEPIYFVAGPDRPNAKFQISFKYQIFNPDGPAAQSFEPLAGLHLAYSQTSFWDWEAESAPFLDSSYRPELLWSAPDLRIDDSWISRLGLQLAVQHESNGRDGDESRSLNIAYVRPSVTFGDLDGLFMTFAPRVYAYIFDQDANNADIEDYRGYADLRLIVGERDGLQLAVTGRVGDDWDKGSAQFDLSYPMRKFFNDSVDLYLHAQYFTGFGESLLEYNESTNRFRMGVSIVR